MQTYETMVVDWRHEQGKFSKDKRSVDQFLRYAEYLTKRGLVANTFGNMVIRVPHVSFPEGVLYTKRRGVSLEECTAEDVVVTAIARNNLLIGEAPPSNGHQMSREIFRHRGDVHAIVHTHANDVCAYFSADTHAFRYVGNDTALVLGCPPKILPRQINLEADASSVADYISGTSCLVMPNHGLVTIGRTLSEAYHRHTAFIAEVRRLVLTVALYPRDESCYLPDQEVQALYQLGDRIIYGQDNPSLPRE